MTKPTIYSQAMADEVCRRLIGGESLTAICDEQGMPSKSTVFYWRHSNEQFRKQYDTAREAQAEAIFTEILDIADDGTNDWVEREFQNGNTAIVLNKEAVQRSNLRVNARQYVLEKLSPKRFGPKSQLDLTSSDGSMSPMSDEAKAARLNAIHQQALARLGKKPAEPDEDDGSDLV